MVSSNKAWTYQPPTDGNAGDQPYFSVDPKHLLLKRKRKKKKKKKRKRSKTCKRIQKEQDEVASVTLRELATE